MAILLTVVPPEKEDLSNKKIMEIGVFVQKLSMNKHLKKKLQSNCITFLPFEVG